VRRRFDIKPKTSCVAQTIARPVGGSGLNACEMTAFPALSIAPAPLRDDVPRSETGRKAGAIHLESNAPVR
jgi:hypothetical protein